ncbi:MAG: VWA domain-containing protein [Luteolibacter sp.]
MSDFTFQNPAALFLLILTIPLAWLLSHARKKRLQTLAKLTGELPTHRLTRDILRLLAFILIVLALARPGHSPVHESSSRTGRDIVFILDVSQSMLAEDTPPSRLEAAKQGIRDALKTFQNERTALVVYAGSASILCPLTYDYEFVSYMLGQANPRTVDFGGTALQSAIEKSINQVLTKDRDGLQDLVVLTDGGDNASNLDSLVSLINETKTDVLLLGLGDPLTGSTIPILDEEKKPTLLHEDDVPVTTRLEDAALRELAAQGVTISYIPLETDPFQLGDIYRTYAKDLPSDQADTSSGIKAYQEAAHLFIIPALILLLLSESLAGTLVPKRPRLTAQATLLLSLLLTFTAKAETTLQRNFQSAIATYQKGEFPEALAQLDTLQKSSTATPGELAAISLNRGLTLLKIAEAQETPDASLNYAQQAQLAFLSAKLSSPEMNRAALRIQTSVELISSLEAQIAKQKKEDEELNAQIQALIERLQSLLASQTDLRTEVAKADVPRPRPNRNKPVTPITPPQNAPSLANTFVKKQTNLSAETVSIREDMLAIDQKLQDPSEPNPADTLMAEPLALMERAKESQALATQSLPQWDTWPQSRTFQLSTEQTIEKILELLSNSPDAGESDDYEDYEEEYEDYEDSDGESTTTSDPTESDLASTSGMTELPTPNYSAEEILQQEQGSLQFRQQQRAESNKGKVEKDY